MNETQERADRPCDADCPRRQNSAAECTCSRSRPEDEVLPNTCQDIADIMEDRLHERGQSTDGADCDDIRKDYEWEFGLDDLTKAYDEANEAGRID